MTVPGGSEVGDDAFPVDPPRPTRSRLARVAVAAALVLALVATFAAATTRPSGRSGAANGAGPASAARRRSDLATTTPSVPAAFADLSPGDRAKAIHFIEVEHRKAALAASGAPTVASFGDSTALLTGIGLATYADRTFARTGDGVLAPKLGWARLGCGLVTTGHRTFGGQLGSQPAHCRRWWDDWAQTVRANPVDVAYVEFGTWDVLTQQPAGFDHPVSLADPRMLALLRTQLERGIAALRGHAKLIVLALPPDIEVGRLDGHSPAVRQPESAPARMALFRHLLQDVAAQHADVTTVDLGGWLAARPDERRLRPDGIHPTVPAAVTIAGWLAPELARRWQATQAEPTR